MNDQVAELGGMQQQPPSMPILRLLRGALRPAEDRAQVALEILSHGDLVRVPFPGKRVYFTKSPADFRRVLSDRASSYRKSFDYRLLAELVGDGLITSEGDVWKRDRRLVQPLFHQQMLAHFCSRVVSLSRDTVDRWSGQGEVCISAEMTRLAIRVIGWRVFSDDVVADADRIADLIAGAQRWLIDRGAAPIDLAKWLPTPGRRAFERNRRELEQLVDAYVGKRLAATAGDDRFDLLSILKESGAPREQLNSHVKTFFAAGYETSAMALIWTCHLLSQHPEWQERLVSELETVLKGRDPKFEDLRRLPQLRAVLEESLRLYPAVPLVGREAVEDEELGGFAIPKGSTVVLCFLAAHRDGRLWADPLRFDPARFLPGRREEQVPYSHLPFGAGARSCIGAQFAMMELALVLATMLPRYRLDPVEGPEVKAVPLVSLRPSRALNVKLVARRQHLNNGA